MPPLPSDPAGHASSRDRLLKAAKRLFAAQGYEQTATSAIARDAGTSESQLMRYFGGKSGVLEALFDEAWRDLNARVQKVLAAPTDSRQTILAVVQTIAAGFARDPELGALMLFEGRRMRGGRARIQLSSGFIEFFESTKTVVRKAQAAGEIIPTLDPLAVVAAIMGAAESLIRERLIARQNGTRAYGEREVRRTLEAILDGFAGPRAATRARPAAARRAQRGR